MPRPQTIIDKEEIDEILALKIQELGGMKSKLTYNNVWNFNKELVVKKIKRSNGEVFNLYGYTFWASGYNGEDYYGKTKIDEIKSVNQVILAGESFDVDYEDIIVLVDRLYKKPEELTRRLTKIFERDRKKVKSIEEQNKKFSSEVITLRNRLNVLENGFINMFFNSQYTTNSLNDVMSLKRTGDQYVIDELKNIFNESEDKLALALKEKRNLYKNTSVEKVVDMHDMAKAKLESEGL